MYITEYIERQLLVEERIQQIMTMILQKIPLLHVDIITSSETNEKNGIEILHDCTDC